MTDNQGPVASVDVDRVRTSTDTATLERIDRKTEEQVRSYATRKGDISRRIEELENEWDIERVLMLNASVIAFAGMVLGVTVDRKWLLLSGGIVLPFLAQHAVQGWCPPVSIFRRLGVRTRREIDGEKFALKALRGDFDSVPPESEADEGTRASEALRAARA